MNILESITDTIKNIPVVKKFNKLSPGKKVGVGAGIGSGVGGGIGVAVTPTMISQLPFNQRILLKTASMVDDTVKPKLYGAIGAAGAAGGAIEGGMYAGGALLAKKAYDKYKRSKGQKK